MALKLLVADSDQQRLFSTKKFFSHLGYEVDTANNGREAQLAYSSSQYYAIILDFELRNHPCLQVIKFITRHNLDQKLIVLVQDPAALATENLNEERLGKIGVLKTFIAPIDLTMTKVLLEEHQNCNDMIASIVKSEAPGEVEDIDSTEGQFSKVRVEEFFSYKICLFDIFVKKTDSKFTKIFKSGDTFSKERFDQYKSQNGNQFIYFYHSERRKHIHYNIFLLKGLIVRPTISTSTKMTFLKNVTEKMCEDIFTIGLKPQHIEQARELSKVFCSFVETESELYKTFKAYKVEEPNRFTHSFLVTLFTCAIIKHFDWQSKSTIETAAMACMLHDVGKTQIPSEIATMSEHEMNASQLEQFKKHPEIGLNMLENFRAVNNSVKQIVLQHHESFDGKGFPHAKKGNKILMLANIVCLIDDLVHLMTDHNLSAVEAVRKLLSSKEAFAARFYPNLGEKLVQMFVSPDKNLSKKVA